jgi:hypothetical protein
MTADEELLTSSLIMLGDGGLDDAELDRRVSRFQGALQQLHDDPAEAARIDALVMDAELGQPDIKAVGGGGIYVSGGNVTITPGYLSETVVAEERIGAALARLEREEQRLVALQETLKETSARTRPRRIWETLLWPAFGGGILVAVLAAATVTAAVHASAAAISIIGIILAAATAVTALLSLWVPWTSVRALNRRGDAHVALELLRRSNPEREAAGSVSSKRSDALLHSGGPTSGPRTPGEWRSGGAENPGWGRSLRRFPPPTYAPSRLSGEQGSQREAGAAAKACVNCGSRLNAADVFCGSCGKAVA